MALYQVLLRRVAKDGPTVELGLTWMPGLKCLNKDVSSRPWLVLGDALGRQEAVRSKAGDFARFFHCGNWDESIEHAFFYCSVVRPL